VLKVNYGEPLAVRPDGRAVPKLAGRDHRLKYSSKVPSRCENAAILSHIRAPVRASGFCTGRDARRARSLPHYPSRPTKASPTTAVDRRGPETKSAFEKSRQCSSGTKIFGTSNEPKVGRPHTKTAPSLCRQRRTRKGRGETGKFPEKRRTSSGLVRA
jgi:hypothetical protein